MKTLNHLCFVFALLAIGLLTATAAPVPDAPVEGFDATVNQRTIYVSDVMALVAPAWRQIESRYRGAEAQTRMNEMYEKARRSLIDRALILEDFKRLGGQIPPRAADSYIRQTIRDRFQNNRTAFLAALKKERLTLDMWRQDIIEQMVLNELRQREVFNRIVVRPAAVDAYYRANPDQFTTPEKVHLWRLAVRKGKLDESDRLRSVAETLRSRWTKSEDARALISEFANQNTHVTGGDLGWFNAGEMEPRMGEAVRGLHVGEVSRVIETEREFWIVFLDDRRAATLLTLEQVRGDIERELRERQAESLYAQRMARLERRHYVATFQEARGPAR